MSSPIEQKRSRFLPIPRMVAEAKEQSQGHSLIVEVLIFVLLYIIGSVLLQGIVTVVGAVLLGAYNEMFQTISESGGNLSTGQINQLTSDVVSSPAMLVFSLFSTAVSIVTVLIYCRYIEKRKLATLGYRSRNFISEYCTGLFVGTLLFGTGVAICYLTGNMQFMGISASIPWGLLALFLLGFMVQGMNEELMCRGYFLVSMSRKQALPIAMLINSIAFSLLHIFNPNITLLAIINLFLFGIFASIYFLKRGNIWGVAAMHTAWNFVQGNVFGISVSGMETSTTIFSFVPTVDGTLLNGGAFGLEGGLAITLVLVVGSVIMLLTKSKQVA